MAVGLLLRKIQVINGPNGSKIDYRKIKERNPERKRIKEKKIRKMDAAVVQVIQGHARSRFHLFN